MIQATMPNTDAEAIIEMGLLSIVKAGVSNGMQVETILKVLERVRHTLTEIKLELDADENQGRR